MGRAHNTKMYVMNNMRDTSQMASSYRTSGYKKIVSGSRLGNTEDKSSEKRGLRWEFTSCN